MSLRAFVQHNFWLKLFSLLLATLIWVAIHFGRESDFRLPQNTVINPTIKEFVRLPVRILTQPGDARTFKVDPHEVIVSITAEAAILREFSTKTITVYVDMSNVRSAAETNQQVKLDIPNGINVINVAPRAVNVELISP